MGKPSENYDKSILFIKMTTAEDGRDSILSRRPTTDKDTTTLPT